MTTPKPLREIVYQDFMDGCDIYYQESGKVLYQYNEEAGMVYYITSYSDDYTFICRLGDIMHHFIGYYMYEGANALSDVDIKSLIWGLLDAFIDTLTLAITYVDNSFYVLDDDDQCRILEGMFDNERLFEYVKCKVMTTNYEKPWVGDFNDI